jgi:lipase
MRSGLQQQFDTFLRNHSPRRLPFGRGVWDYYACGQGSEAVLLLPGAPGRGETSFEYICAWETQFRVISPGYPSHLTGMAETVDGLLAILDAEGVERAHVVGGSYSGLVAQCLVRSRPRRVESLVL